MENRQYISQLKFGEIFQIREKFLKKTFPGRYLFLGRHFIADNIMSLDDDLGFLCYLPYVKIRIRVLDDSPFPYFRVMENAINRRLWRNSHLNVRLEVELLEKRDMLKKF